MKELIEELESELMSLREELHSYADGNKAAGRRARRHTLNIERLGKQFRKESVAGTPEKEK